MPASRWTPRPFVPGGQCRGNLRLPEDRILNLRHAWLCCVLLTLLSGCAAKVAPAPRGSDGSPPKTATPKASSPKKAIVPEAKHLGPVLNMNMWKIQCSNENLAMLCRKSDPTDRRCADKRRGKFRWTYGSYCHRALACYKRACR